MCVIMYVSKTRPTKEMVASAWSANSHGGGIAWPEETIDEATGEVVKEVVWKKGIENVEDMQKLCAAAPIPYVAHFRVASVGGIRPTLTHPFIISNQSPLELEGRTTGDLLFHNGHWGEWAEKSLELAIRSNTKIPTGDWSDSRAMAWACSILGNGFMDFQTKQKGVIVRPDGDNFDFFMGNGWDQINGVWCSNDHFWSRKNTASFTGPYCVKGRCMEPRQSGKTMCAKCEAETLAEKQTTASTGTGGATTINVDSKLDAATPVRMGGTKGPLAMFSLNEAEKWYRKGAMTKSQVKKFRKWYPELGKLKGERLERAQKILIAVTRTAEENEASRA